MTHFIFNTLRASMVSILVLGGGSAFAASDSLQYCNAVQNRTGFIRYPLGTVGAWSTAAGEAADVMTRVPRVYPCANAVTIKPGKDDWRGAISGDPSLLMVQYKPEKPCGASSAAITVAPHVTVFNIKFPENTRDKYLVFDFSKGTIESWSALAKWTERSITRVDDWTIRATIGQPGKAGAYYIIRFSEPCTGIGSIDAAGAITVGATESRGTGAGMYARFDAPAVTVAIAESFTSMAKAEAFLTSEFSDFETVHVRCREAWNQILGRVAIEGAENGKRMAYTALYTMYVNIINGDDGSCYLPHYPRPRSLASSAYWQFIGGFQSCCWDNWRAAYPLLCLAYPDVMSDVVNTYLARYRRDGYINGNICLFTGPVGGHQSMAFPPVTIAQAMNIGVQAEYGSLCSAFKDNFANDAYAPASLATKGYVVQPASGGKGCSETLDFSTGFHSLAILARANNDAESAEKYLRLSKSYANLWDNGNKVFRVKNADGSWGPIENAKWTWDPNPQGLFEGTSRDWAFSAPHDPFGMLNLPGQDGFAERVTSYCLNDTWFNDYQYVYPYLLYYAGRPNDAQKIIRTAWISMFDAGVMYEGVRPKVPHNGWQTHYTSNAGWLLCSMLGLYPVPAPPGQFIISSPSLSKATIHNGTNDITVQANNNSGDNIYIRSIRLDGKPYPCYMIPAKRLAGGAKIELEMSNDPSAALADLYIGASDGFIMHAELISASRLQFVVEAPVAEATTKVLSRIKPAKVIINGRDDRNSSYDEATRSITIQSTGTATVEVILPG